MSEEKNKFQEALDAAVGERTEADKAASNASMDAQMVAFEARVVRGDYDDVPGLADKLRTDMMAIRIRAGLAPAPTPKTPQELAAEQSRPSMPYEVHANMQLMLDAGLAELDAKGGMHVAEETDKLAERLGRETHAAMVASAKKYLGEKYTPTVAAYLPALRVAAQLARRPT